MTELQLMNEEMKQKVMDLIKTRDLSGNINDRKSKIEKLNSLKQDLEDIPEN